MGYAYTPAYYTSVQDRIASLCKSILHPFSLHAGRRITADQAAARRHADALKWQQDSFHRILHLSALHREGMVPTADVAAFRASMLAALLAPTPHPDPPAVLRDKLLFLQELLYAKCISPEEFNASKRPLLQRLAALGVEIECRDADVGAAAPKPASSEEEEWSVIDLQDPAPAAPDHKAPTASKYFISSWKSKGKKEQTASNPQRPPLEQMDLNPAKNPSILMAEISPSAAMPSGKTEKAKRTPITALFHNGSENKEPAEEGKETAVRGRKKSSWGFDGIRKWKKAGGGSNEDDTVAAAAGDCPPRSSYSERRLEASRAAAAGGPDTKRARKKLHSGDDSASDLLNDKVLVENAKKELSRIQAELSSTNQKLNFSDRQIEAISTRLPADKSDLKTFFPKAWCDQHGDGVINAVKKEFKEHVQEMGRQRDWVAFEEDNSSSSYDNVNPRAFSHQHHKTAVKGRAHESINTDHFSNPFYDEKNPFWDPNDN